MMFAGGEPQLISVRQAITLKSFRNTSAPFYQLRVTICSPTALLKHRATRLRREKYTIQPHSANEAAGPAPIAVVKGVACLGTGTTYNL